MGWGAKNACRVWVIMGFGVINNHCPLFADAINEKGLAIAALNFPFNAKYYEYDAGKINLAPYELILYLLAKCSNILEVKLELLFINLLNEDFSNKVKLTPLHFLISDQRSSIVVESTSNGLEVFDNEYEILTNNPPFLIQKEYVSNYKFLSNDSFDPALTSKRSQQYFSFGSFAHGLPGDYSSSYRFIHP